jgi:hypothetical protein
MFPLPVHKMSLEFLLASNNREDETDSARIGLPLPLPSIRVSAASFPDHEHQIPGSPVSQKHSRGSSSGIQESSKRTVDHCSSSALRKTRVMSKESVNEETSNDFAKNCFEIDGSVRLPPLIFEKGSVTGDPAGIRNSRWLTSSPAHPRDLDPFHPNQAGGVRPEESMPPPSAPRRDHIRSRSRMHSALGPNSAMHVCFCGRAFNKREHLKRHNMLVHQEVRPFKCNACELRFGTKQNMQVHLSTRKHRQRLAGKRPNSAELQNNTS